MPLHRPLIDRDRTYQEEEIPMSGSITLRVRVAFPAAPFKPRTNDPLRELAASQRLTPPVTTKINVQKP